MSDPIIYPPAYNDDVRSKPIRDTINNFKNYMTGLKDSFNSAVGASTTSSETINARDYEAVLMDRLRTLSSATGKNYLVTGGVVTVNAVTTKVDISAGTAIVGGVGCKWNSQTSGALSPAAAGKHRVDVVVINSNNTITILAGAESLKASTDPVFPVPSTSQLGVYALFIDDTGVVNLTNKIYALKEDHPTRKNYYIKQPQTVNKKFLKANNIIIDSTLTVYFTDITGFLNFTAKYLRFSCIGYFYITASGSIIPNSLNRINNSFFGNGGVGSSAGANTWGAAGGASAVADGGVGGKSGGAQTSIAGSSTTRNSLNSNELFNFSSGNGGAGKTSPENTSKTGFFLLIKAYSISIKGAITNNGGNGSGGVNSGNGGNAGGSILLFAENDITISAITINLNGGSGENHATAGGGGGGGGYFWARSKTYTSTATILVNGGAAGTGGAGSAPTAGSNGSSDQKLFSNVDSTEMLFPFSDFSEQE